MRVFVRERQSFSHGRPAGLNDLTVRCRPAGYFWVMLTALPAAAARAGTSNSTRPGAEGQYRGHGGYVRRRLMAAPALDGATCPGLTGRDPVANQEVNRAPGGNDRMAIRIGITIVITVFWLVVINYAMGYYDRIPSYLPWV